jgi:hypothetical protein
MMCSGPDGDSRAPGRGAVPPCISWEEFLTSPLTLAAVGFLIVWFRLETTKINAQLTSIQDRNARNDEANGMPPKPPAATPPK